MRALRSGELIRVGMVGLGYWGPNRLRVLLENERVAVTHICDVDQERLGRFAKRHPSIRATPCYQDLLDDPDLDVIVLATPVSTHFDLAARSLQAGKHTFVEKPLAPSSAEADELIELAEQASLVLCAGHTFLHSPPVQEVKRILERGELGEIYFISSSRVNLGLHQKDVSVLWDLAPHDFSMLLYWLEERPIWISAVGRDSVVKGVPDVAFVDMAFPSGVIANVELSWLAPSKLRRTVIVGSEKMVLYDDTSNEAVRIFDQGVVYQDPETFGEYHLSYRTGDVVSPNLPTGEPISLEFDSFVNAVQAGEDGSGSARLARDIVAMIEMAEASLAAESGPRRQLDETAWLSGV